MTASDLLRKVFILLSCMMVSCLIFQTPVLFASEEICSNRQNICFQWFFIAKLKQDKKLRAINLNENNIFESGDQLKASFKLKKKCFLYFIHTGPKNEISLLYPYALPQDLSSNNMPTTYHIPRNGRWFMLDNNTGNETFFLIAASTRLGGLESLLIDYQKIIKKLKGFNQQSKKLAAAAERPIQIGGTVRSGICKDNKISLQACDSLMVSAKDFYIKAITIEHK